METDLLLLSIDELQDLYEVICLNLNSKVPTKFRTMEAWKERIKKVLEQKQNLTN